MTVRKLILLFADRAQILANAPNDATVVALATCAKELTYNDEGEPRTLFALALGFIGDSGVPAPFQGRTCLAFEVLPDNAVKPIQCNQLAFGNVCASEVIVMARKLYEGNCDYIECENEQDAALKLAQHYSKELERLA